MAIWKGFLKESFFLAIIFEGRLEREVNMS
jgi:hypothetical protein